MVRSPIHCPLTVFLKWHLLHPDTLHTLYPADLLFPLPTVTSRDSKNSTLALFHLIFYALSDHRVCANVRYISVSTYMCLHIITSIFLYTPIYGKSTASSVRGGLSFGRRQVRGGGSQPAAALPPVHLTFGLPRPPRPPLVPHTPPLLHSLYAAMITLLCRYYHSSFPSTWISYSLSPLWSS